MESHIDLNNTPRIIIENKCDLLGEEEKHNDGIEELKQFSENNGFSVFFRTSALNGYNIEKAMDFLIEEILITLEENKTLYDEESFLSQKLDSKKSSEKNGKCC